MSETVLEQSLQLVLQETTAAAAIGLLLAAGLVGMSIRSLVESVVTSDENPEEGEPIGDGGTTGFVADDPRGSDGQSGSGPIDRVETDAAETPTDGDGDSENLEHRLDELEKEVDSLSSTVSTVRNENEQISESVQDIEENTGRLLNLYEMATRGVNPFAGNAESPEPDQTGVEEETAKTDPADSDAEVHDGSEGPVIREEHCVDSVEEVVETETEPADAFQKRKQETSETGDDGATPDGLEEITQEEFDNWFGEETEPADGTETDSFGKEEMIETSSRASTGTVDGGDSGTRTGSESTSPPETESDDASSQTPEDEGSPTPAAGDGGTLVESTGASENVADTSTGIESDAEDVLETTLGIPAETEPELDGVMGADAPETSPSDPQQSTTAGGSEDPVEPTVTTPGGHAGTAGKPYIESLPEGFSAEVITVEWLEYLIDEVGLKETVRAIHYYENIDWLTEDAAEELDAYLDGFDADEQGRLSVDVHLQSLDYVEELTATDALSGGPEDSE